jgi:hypothetical protein
MVSADTAKCVVGTLIIARVDAGTRTAEAIETVEAAGAISVETEDIGPGKWHGIQGGPGTVLNSNQDVLRAIIGGDSGAGRVKRNRFPVRVNRRDGDHDTARTGRVGAKTSRADCRSQRRVVAWVRGSPGGSEQYEQGAAKDGKSYSLHGQSSERQEMSFHLSLSLFSCFFSSLTRRRFTFITIPSLGI